MKLTLNLTDFLTSDEHFWHNNVIKYCGRPHKDAEEMNEDLVKRHNAIVKPENTVLRLGDFSMAFRAVEVYPYRLNGKKILVPGNHDFCHSYHKKSRNQADRDKWVQKYKDHGFEVLPERTTLILPEVGEVNICHHPYQTNSDVDYGDDKYDNWRPIDDGKVLLCGHVHEKWKTKRSTKGTLMINVGVDVNNYAPISVAQIIEIIKENK